MAQVKFRQGRGPFLSPPAALPTGRPATIYRVMAGTDDTLASLMAEIRACRVCADALGFAPRPVMAAGHAARILVIGQAPGSKAHASGKAWDDDSGDRLRGWLGIGHEAFYDPERVAHMPSGFCYPGRASGGDLPPRRECAPLWHGRLLAELPAVRLTLLIGAHAQKRYLPRGFALNLTEAVRQWQAAPAGLFPLPHPAWRSRLWMARHPWFEAQVLPALRSRVAEALSM